MKSVSPAKLLSAAAHPARTVASALRRYSLDSASGILLPPQEVFFNLCWNCNFRCGMCDIGRRNADSGIGGKFLKDRPQMSFDEWARVIGRFAGVRPAVQFTGTEPTLHKDFLKIVAAVKEKGFPVSITTNGWTLDRYLEDLVRLGVETIGISLDGLRPTHDSIRGMEGSFDRIMAAIDAFAGLKAKYPRSKTKLNTNTTISQYNYRELAALYDLLSARPVERIGFSHLWFRTERSCEAHNREVPGFKAVPSNLVVPVSAIPARELADALRALAGKPKVTFYPDLTEKELADYYADPEKKIVRGGCKMPWRQMEIMPDGEIILGSQCFETAPLGNALKDDPLDIWKKHATLKELRGLLKKNGYYLPGCSRCCVLYKYDRP